MDQKNDLRGSRFFSFGSVAVLSLTLFCSSGCNMCCPPYLDDYATVGGKWARANPTEGRVGSAFSDPGVLSASGEVPEFPTDGGVVPVPMQEEIEVFQEGPLEDSPMILGEGW